MLTQGMTAPDFTLPDKEGRLVSLSDFRGKTVVLYFYPKDNTPGCTRQACAFRDAYDEFLARGAVVIGVSRDGAVSHRNFADRHGLPFYLLSDPERTVLEAYGVWQEKKLYGKIGMGVARTTFIIGGDGTVRRVFEKVKPDQNTAEVLACLNDEN